jgi:hypothetical protein
MAWLVTTQHAVIYISSFILYLCTGFERMISECDTRGVCIDDGFERLEVGRKQVRCFKFDRDPIK